MDALQDLRRTYWTPVIIVSGRSDEITRIRGLEEGADDYIVKPFSHTELLARINAVLRRVGKNNNQEGPIVVAGRDLVIDHEKRRLDVDGQPVDLTNTEWALLAYLVRNEGKTISTQALATAVWGSSYVEGSAIRMCIRRLRLKLGDDTHNPEIIRSHRGVGYSFDPSREASAL
jgi:DNA-binding response OmpR family regulator